MIVYYSYSPWSCVRVNICWLCETFDNRVQYAFITNGENVVKSTVNDLCKYNIKKNPPKYLDSSQR